MDEQRIRCSDLRARVLSADEAQAYIRDGMTVAVSGFTKSGDAKAVLQALAARVQRTGDPLKINLLSGASLGETDAIAAKAGIIRSRAPYQSEPVLRNSINRGEVKYTDQHLSHTAEYVRSGCLGEIDLAIIEATAITETGGIVPTTSVGNSPIFVERAKQVIVEINVNTPAEYEGLHDIYLPAGRPNRAPIPITRPADRIGTPYIPCDPAKIIGVVFSTLADTPSSIVPADHDTQRMAEYILEFFDHEVRHGRLPNHLAPLQSGVGSVSNAVLSGLAASRFENLEIYTEVMQDAVFELFGAEKIAFASASSFTLSQRMARHVNDNLARYRDKLVLRPQEISNHPEVVRRLGVIAMNTALEVDIYGNVNSTHVNGTHMMNGIGGSGDFARNAGLTIFVTKSIAKGGRISSVVPFVPHVDHTEHDVDVLVTEQGIADVRGLAPRDRALTIIQNLAHPDYKEALLEYFKRASQHGGHTPHLLTEALRWHQRYVETGDMRVRQLAKVTG
ncbi:acetyl-CoA hydrolase/transferase family protein [Alicyclobacillus cycloheptanicus]|uniref:Succinyl-CoA:acetate CoA-transferase n=1 Tax=Alicyclobacillus cycloheptanicus TaxID=1457 RepID=A0ABT9XEZ3_9BACL|nr:acetyl-CoA hydrolase/transferase family protein [Alicyclobacillus cycloheptanicus]MDQ0188862.1 succinyl-CoA:acetate CoA-transferase [Alicyclobacillus cycloheptanicus]WDM00494.1 acetyl-CoA hydrolase/transferase family protein [Alicyclobacillus cycloheptanicus]